MESGRFNHLGSSWRSSNPTHLVYCYTWISELFFFRPPFFIFYSLFYYYIIIYQFLNVIQTKWGFSTIFSPADSPPPCRPRHWHWGGPYISRSGRRHGRCGRSSLVVNHYIHPLHGMTCIYLLFPFLHPISIYIHI